MKSFHRALVVSAVAGLLILGAPEQAAAFTAKPSAIDFGDQPVGLDSTPLTVAIENDGVQLLQIVDVQITGVNASEFAVFADTCAGVAIPPIGDCGIQVQFTPLALGPRVAQLEITGDDGTPVVIIPLTGEGVIRTQILAAVSVPLPFPDTPAGLTSAVQNVTVQNIGNTGLVITNIVFAPGYVDTNSFVVTSDDCLGSTLDPLATCEFGIRFAPTNSGAKVAVLDIQSSGGNILVDLVGSGIEPGIFTVPTSLDYGTQQVGVVSAPLSVIVQNTGNGPLTLTSFTIGGTNFNDFVVDAGACLGAPLQPLEACAVDVTFQPGARGPRFGVLVIEGDALNSPQTVTLQGIGGTGVPSINFDPAALAFGEQVVGSTSAVQQIVVQNTGTATLLIQAVTNSNTNEFFVGTTCLNASIAPGATCAIPVAFRPQASGLRDGVIEVISNAGGGTNQIALTGSGVAPEMTLSTTSLDFGTNVVGVTSAAQSITITNSGDAALLISNVTIGGLNPGDFNILSNPCVGTPILPGKTCQISLNFTTTTALPRSAVLTITGNATNSPQTVALSGVGKQFTCPTITLTPASLPAGSSSETYSQTITASGGLAPYTFQVISGALPSELTLSSAGQLSGTLLQTGTFNFVVQATDANGCGGNQAYSLTVGCSTLTLLPAPADLAPATKSVAYLQRLSLTLPSGQVVGGYQTFDNNTPVVLPAAQQAPILSSSIYVSGIVAAINDVDLSLYLQYSEDCGDQSLVLIAPDGTEVVVSSKSTNPNQVCQYPFGIRPYTQHGYGVACSPESARTTFDDAGGPSVTAGVWPYQGIFQPENALAGFAGTNTTVINGAWRLELREAGGWFSDGGTNYCWSLAISFGRFAFAVTAGSLPPGISITSSGKLIGTPTQTGSFSFTVTATDSSGCTANQTYTLTVAPATPVLTFNPALLPTFGDVIVGATSAVQTVTIQNTGVGSLVITNLVLGGANPDDFVLEPGSSCLGASFTPGGTCQFSVRFKPTTSGYRNADVVVYDNSAGNPHTYPLSGGGIAPVMTLSRTSLDFGTNVVGVTSPPQSIRITNTGDGALVISSMTLGGLNSNDFAIVSNECLGNSILPGQTCQISLNFTTTTALSRSAVLTIVGNATNSPQTVALSGVGREFQCPAILVTPSTLPDATRALPYLQAITAINGVAPYRFVLTGGALPPGISLVENLLVGTAQLPGTNSFQITVYDANNCAAVQNYTLIVVCPTLTIAPANLTNPQLGLPYDVTFTVSGAVAPVVFEIVDGGLPVGMDLDPAGNLSGAPAESGTFSFTVSATDSTGCTATRVYSFQISCPALSVSPNLLPAPQVGVPYNQTLAGVGGVSPYLFFRTAGAIPDGLALTTDGVLSGTVTSIGQYSFTVRAVDDAGCAGERVYTVKTVCPPLAISGTLPLGEVDVPYSTSMTATGGTAPYTFTAIAGSIPSGLVLDSDGTLSGVPTSGSSVFTVQATDANGCTGTRQYLITIAVPPPSILVGPSSLPAAVVETGFSQTLSAAGGVAPYSFSVASGSLPTGLNLAATGQISGTPTTAGEYPVIIAARDGTGQTGSQTYMMQVACPSFSLSPTSLPGGIQGTPYQQQLGVNHGGPVTYIVTSGVLPAGLVLGEDGLLAGTPTAAGSFGFTVRATLANGCATERTWALVVAPVGGSNGVADLQVLASASAAVATQGQVIAFTAVVTNAGPSSATGVTLVQTFSLPVNVSSVPAGVQVLGNTLIYTRSQLAAGGREAVVVQVAPQQIGTLTSSVTLTANQTDPSPGNNQAAAAVVVSGASAQVVTANATGTLMLTDTDGDIVTLQLRGGGTLSAVRETTGRILEIQLQNTGPASALRLKVKRAVSGDGTLTVGAVTGNGALRQLSARQLHLNGAGLTLAGYVARVDIGDILNGAAVRLGGTAAVRTTLRLHVLADGCQIVSGSALGSLQAARLGQGQVTAPSFGRVKVTGDRKQGIVAANEATLVIASGTP